MSEWISVKDRLPENYEEVLVWFEYFRYGEYNGLYQTWGIGEYFENYNSWMINHETGWHKLRVIAWMELPMPFDERKKNKVSPCIRNKCLNPASCCGCDEYYKWKKENSYVDDKCWRGIEHT